MPWEGKIGFRLEREHKSLINLWVRNIHRLFPASSQGIKRNTALLSVFLYSSCPARSSRGELDLPLPVPLPRVAIRISTKPLQHVQMISSLVFMEGREKVVLEVIIRSGFLIYGGGKHLLVPPCLRFAGFPNSSIALTSVTSKAQLHHPNCHLELQLLNPCHYWLGLLGRKKNCGSFV